MTQPDHPATRGPKGRTDSTRPASVRSRGRRGADRRPYPTAPTRTKPSPAGPRKTGARTRSRGSSATPTPATVWTSGPTPIDPDATWPAPIVAKIVTSFSEPGGRVVLLPWPATTDRPTLTPVGADGVIDSPITTAPGAELADALAAIDDLDRTGRVVRIEPDPAAAGPGSRPFWADLVGDPGHSPAAVPNPPGTDIGSGVLDRVDTAPADVDLIITSLRPEHGGDHSSDLVALLAARLLRVGGILVVLTHCEWSRGELVDPSGPVVAAGQNADLLYLQHIVALHAPVADGQFVSQLDGPAAVEQTRSTYRALARGLPAPHRRIHSDVLVFAQPHDHEPPPLAAAGAAFETGVIR